MVNISNKTIVSFLVVALVITLASTIINISKISGMDNLITGAATNATTGTATLTVASQTEVTLQVTDIAFGSGYVNTTTAGCDSCELSTLGGPAPGNASCCSEFNNVTAGFLVENTGNENVSLNMTCEGSCTAAAFINGTGPSFTFGVTNSSDGATDGSASNNSGDSVTDTSGSCGSGNGWNYTTNPVTTAGTDMAATTFDLCGSNGSTEYYFDSTGPSDAMIVDIRLVIPDDAITNAQQGVNLTFGATSAG
jgi:hypothetical protein